MVRQRLAYLILSAHLLAALVVFPSHVDAADIAVPAPPAPAWQPGFEARFGAFAHGVGNPEKNTVDLSGEVVSPRFVTGTAFWTYLVPRLHAGGSVNLSGKTSFGYAGILLTIPVVDRWFVEGYFDGAFHNGVLDGDPTRSAMGCNPLFHSGASVGYRFNAHWSVLGTFEHLSDGKQAFGMNCNRNQGLNNYGVRLGYAF